MFVYQPCGQPAYGWLAYTKETLTHFALLIREVPGATPSPPRRSSSGPSPQACPVWVLLEMFSNSDAFTDSDIRQHVDTFVVAGEDTTAGVSMYCMLLVGSYSQVQDKIYEEINEIFGDDERDVTKEDLSRLVYLEAVLKETMRFYPIVPIIGRHLDKDVKLRNCTLSKGRTAILSIYGIHRHPMWGPDADEFRPERWLSPLSNIQKMFAGFSMGRRICIGKTYAMASLKVILVHVFRNYIIHSDHTKCTFDLDITLKPTSGHHITIERRNKNKP
ncbi:putative cytochrome P450, partial [Danaus plexippus plexippus]